MSRRFFVAQALAVGGPVRVTGPEAHHIVHVMRLSVGDPLVLFDGSGAEYHARVLHLTKRDVDVEVLSRLEIDRESSTVLELAVALPRGDRQLWLVEKAVELGVESLVPLITERGVAQPADKSLGRLQRTVIESSKQCGRNRLLRIGTPVPWSVYVSTDDAVGVQRWLAHPVEQDEAASASLNQSIRFAANVADRYRVAIGPEGGFTVDEIRLARDYHWQMIWLGPRILRVETAALAVSSAILLGDLTRPCAAGRLAT